MDTSSASSPAPSCGSESDREFNLAYAQLRALAHNMLQGQRAGHTLQATALVHEAYMRLLMSGGSVLSDAGRFHRVAAVAMRNILVDHARGRARLKRAGRIEQLSLDAVELAGRGANDEILVVDEAIERLRGSHPELANLVQMRFFAGLTIEQVASALGQSERTIYRDWTYAKALLLRELRE